MGKSAPTWFGFTLTQKQAVTIFVLALTGFLICTFVFITFFISMYMNFYYANMDPYYYMDEYYMTSMIISSLPILIFFFVIFIICCYSLSMCKQTAKYNNRVNSYPQSQTQIQTQHRTYTPRAPQKIVRETLPAYKMMFCSNCGTKHGESHQFCINCGYSLI